MAVALRCQLQADDPRPGRGPGSPSAPRPLSARYSCQASVGRSGVSAGVTVNFSAGSLAAAGRLAHAAAQLGTEGLQVVGDAAQATADFAGDVLEHATLAGVVGAAVASTLL